MKLYKLILLWMSLILLTGCATQSADLPITSADRSATDTVVMGSDVPEIPQSTPDTTVPSAGLTTPTVTNDSASTPGDTTAAPPLVTTPIPVTTASQPITTTVNPATTPVTTTQEEPSVLKAILHEEGNVGYIAYEETDFAFKLSCPQAFVYDMNEGVILYAKGMDQIVYPASTTKLLTILYSLTVLSPDELITPGNELKLVNIHSSFAHVESSHTLSVEMLIEGMLLPSGNDAAYALAGAAGRKIAGDPDLDGKTAIEVFMEGLNAYAREIGCVGTSFTVPDGFFDENHYTTMEDLILISRMAAENELIRKYAALPCDEVTFAGGNTVSWTNTNLMIQEDSPYYSPYVTGLKTGAGGGYHFICTAEKDGQRYLIGVFGGSDKNVRFADTLKVLNELFGE
ncbi:MAG: hypothetical protein ACI3YK_05375 [Eubacteriales bacterium]